MCKMCAKSAAFTQTGRWSDWPVSDEKLEAHKFKACLPFLLSVINCVHSIKALLSKYCSAGKSVDFSSISATFKLLAELFRCFSGRRFLRDHVTTALNCFATAALELPVVRTERLRQAHCAAASSGGRLLSRKFFGSDNLLACRCNRDDYKICANLLSFGAVETRDSATLDNFISGNVGS
jgi:hypothetical protein